MDTRIAIYVNGHEAGKIEAARSLAATPGEGQMVTVYELTADDKIADRIEVYPRHMAFGGVAGAQVNWGGIGSVGAAKARRYAGMITLAAELIELSDEIAAAQ